MSHEAAERPIKVEGGMDWLDELEDEEPLEETQFPQTRAEARMCVHGNSVWFGRECGKCEAVGHYEWADD